MKSGIKSAIFGAALALLGVAKSSADYEFKGNTLNEREEAAYHHLVEGMDKLGIPREEAAFYLATMAKESSLDSTKVNSTSQATGYFQVTPLTASHLGYTPEEMLDPEKAVEAGLRYSLQNRKRFSDPELDSAAHNQGPTSLDAILDQESISTADEYIRFLEENIETNTPVSWYNRFHGRTDTLTVDKMREVVRFHKKIQDYEEGFEEKIENYGLGIRWEDEKEQPNFVMFGGEECLRLTAIKGDGAYRLAEEYTGEPGKNQKLISKVNQRIEVGGEVYIPRRLLLPELQDGEHETFYLDTGHQTIFSWANEITKPDSSPFTKYDISTNSRRIQRASGIIDPNDMDWTDKIFIPSGLLGEAGVLPTQPLVSPTQPVVVAPLDGKTISIDYSHATTGLSRTPNKGYFRTKEYKRRTTTSKLIDILSGRGELRANLVPRELDMVIYHTTEHGRNSWENALDGIRRDKSAHYFINPHGEIYSVVPLEDRANAAGRSVWDGVHGLDFNSVNIEVYANVERKPHESITSRQTNALRDLTEYLQDEVPTLDKFLGHNQVAVSYDWRLSNWGNSRKWKEFLTDSYAHRQRKGDPGRDFPWLGIGLPNMYEEVDPDVLSGRVKNNHERGKHRILPGQLNAEDD